MTTQTREPAIRPGHVYFLANDATTSSRPLRDASEMTTSAIEMGDGGLLICMPDFDALTEQVIRSAG